MKMISYSHNREDVLLNRVFAGQTRGQYIDVGALHPVLASVTYHFYLQGWSGVNVEPIPERLPDLLTIRPRDMNLSVGLSDRVGEATFYQVKGEDGLSTFVAAQAEEYRRQGRMVVERTLPVLTLAELCGRHVKGTIDFMSIDVEGHERAVLAGGDWRRWRPRLVVLEATRPYSTIPTHHLWEDLLLTADYQFGTFDGLNRYYVRREDSDLLARLAVPVNVFDAFEPHEYVSRIANVEWVLAQTQEQLRQTQEQLCQTQVQLRQTQEQPCQTRKTGQVTSGRSLLQWLRPLARRGKHLIQKSSSLLRRAVRSHPRVMALTLGLCLSACVLVLLEAAFGVANARIARGQAPVNTDYQPASPWDLDELLGYKLKENACVHSRKTAGDHEIYHVVYTTDAWRRRATPVKDPIGRTRFLLCFGCSLTFGEGVNDDETMPYYAGEFARQYVPYNYAVGGYGPQQMLVKLQKKDLAGEIKERSGILVFTVTTCHPTGHIDRAIGSMQVCNVWGGPMPYYHCNGQNTLVRDGSFNSGRPFTAWAYSLLGKSELCKYFHLDLPLWIRDSHVQTTARIIQESARLFHEQFPGSEFWVLFHPMGDPSLNTRLQACLAEAGIRYLDVSDTLNYAAEGFFIVGDGHCAPLGNRAVAQRLTQDLGIAHPENGGGG